MLNSELYVRSKGFICFTFSVEEDKVLESALAEFWDIDNRWQLGPHPNTKH